MEQVLGKTVEDVVSGFSGIATIRTDFLSGNVQYTVCGTAKDDKVPELCFDIHQLEVVKDGRSLDVVKPTERFIGLGSLVEDQISGYKGTVLRRCTFMNGCIYYAVGGKYDSKAEKQEAFYEGSRLTVLRAVPPPQQPVAKGPGGPAYHVPARG